MEKIITINETNILKKATSQLEDKYHLVYLSGYDDVIPARIIDECIKKESSWPLFEEDCYAESRRHSAASEATSLPALKALSKDELELFKTTEEYRELLDLIEERDYSMPEKDALKQTQYNARVVLTSNYDCWVPAYDSGGLYSQEDALSDTMRFLSLNPAKVKKAVNGRLKCFGRWRDYRNREGKEVVRYEDFAEVLVNACGYGLWSFFGRLDLPLLAKQDFNYDNLTIPKGTECTMFNWWNGSGSLAFATTIRDVSIKDLKKQSNSQYTAPKLQGDETKGEFDHPAKSVYCADFKETLLIKPQTTTQ